MKYYSATDIGVYRSENQDSSIILKDKNVIFAAVCDGMGGHFGGQFASRLTILAIKKMFKKHLPSNPKTARKWIENTFTLAKKIMRKEAASDPKLLDMGTTITCIFIYKKSALIFNVGDSRVYAFNGIIHKITEDHNLSNYYIKHQGMSEEKAMKIRGGAALTSALGPTKDINVSAYEVDLKGIQYFILTTDGIHDYIGKPLFELLLTSQKDSMETICKKIISNAIEGGSKDNLTIVLLECD